MAFGIGEGILVAAEPITSTRSIGFPIMSEAQFLATDVVFVGTAIIQYARSVSAHRCSCDSAHSCHGKAKPDGFIIAGKIKH